MGIRKRKIEADYLNTGTAVAPAYALCGTGFTALTESPSAQTASKRYINQSSARQSITGYEWKAAFEADQIKDEAALAFILNISDKLLTGADAETDLVQVDLDIPSPAGQAIIFHARKRTVAIAVAEAPDNDGELGVNGDILGVSDPVEGTFNVNTKAFVVGGAATYLTTFSVTGTASARLAGVQILINGQLLTTDDNGMAEIQLAAGAHAYTVVASGYTTIEDSLTVVASPVYEAVTMTAA